MIDEDSEGKIRIMVEADKGVTIIPQGARITQLLLMPRFHTNNPFLKPHTEVRVDLALRAL